MDDINLLRRAIDDANRVIEGIRTDQLDGATPCDDFTVQQLATHLAEGAEMFAVALDGGPASDDQSLKAVGDRLVAAFQAPGGLDGIVQLPYAELPRAVALHHSLGETAIHTADLAHATGQAIGDDAVYERALAVVDDGWRVEGVLGPVQPCADDAPLADRLLAFAGRKI